MQVEIYVSIYYIPCPNIGPNKYKIEGTVKGDPPVKIDWIVKNNVIASTYIGENGNFYFYA